jgi:hypothetical protein
LGVLSARCQAHPLSQALRQYRQQIVYQAQQMTHCQHTTSTNICVGRQCVPIRSHHATVSNLLRILSRRHHASGDSDCSLDMPTHTPPNQLWTCSVLTAGLARLHSSTPGAMPRAELNNNNCIRTAQRVSIGNTDDGSCLTTTRCPKTSLLPATEHTLQDRSTSYCLQTKPALSGLM